MWDPCCEGMTGCDARTESGPVSDWDGPGPTQAALHWAQGTVHLVMRHNHHSVSAFIILEILIRKEEVNRLAEGVIKISSAYVLFWLPLNWADDQQSRSQDIFPSVTLSPLPPHSTFTLIILTHYAACTSSNQPQTWDKHMLQTSMIMFIWIN